MKKIDDILNQLRQQPDVSNPEQLTQRIMDSLQEQDVQNDAEATDRKPARRLTLRVASAIAVAAAVLLLLVLKLSQGAGEDIAPTVLSENVGNPQEEIMQMADDDDEGSETPSDASLENSRMAQAGEQIRTPRPSGRQLAARQETPSAADDLDDYMEQLEQGLADVCDSCYLAQVEHMISGSEDLQQLMDEMTNQTLYNGNYE